MSQTWHLGYLVARNSMIEMIVKSLMPGINGTSDGCRAGLVRWQTLARRTGFAPGNQIAPLDQNQLRRL